MDKRDVIVVGAGISGLLSALALAKEGRKVLVLERAPEVGGVCRSYNVDGYQVDTGTHIITRLDSGPLKELMQRYFDVVPNFVPHGKYYVRLNRMVRPFPWNLQGWMSFDCIPQMDRVSLLSTLLSTSYLFNAGQDLSKKPIGEIVGKNISPSTRSFLDCLSIFMTGTPIDETPVERFLDSQHYKTKSSNIVEKLYKALMSEGAVDQCYPKGGVQSIVTAIQSSLPEKRVEVRTSEEVVSINPAKKTLETDKDEYKYELLVYSGFASNLPSLTDSLEEDYVASLQKLPTTKALTIWLGLDEQVFKSAGSEIWVDCDPYTWVVPISNYDPSLAPKKKQLVGFMFRLPDGCNAEKEKKRALSAIYDVMPSLEKKVDMVHNQVLIPEKAAWTVSTQFTGVRTPLEDVYLVGTDTERKSMGVTRASYSVLRLLEALKKDKAL